MAGQRKTGNARSGLNFENVDITTPGVRFHDSAGCEYEVVAVKSAIGMSGFTRSEVGGNGASGVGDGYKHSPGGDA